MTGCRRWRAGEPGDRARDRGGEQRRLVDLGQRAEDPLEVVGEAHVEHLVGLVEHDGLDLVEADRPALEVVHRAARRRDHDVDPAREPVELRGDRLAAVDGHDPRAELATVLVHRLGHLHRELAGRRQDERPGPAPLLAARGAPRPSTARPAARSLVEPRREPLEHRQGERRGLARPVGASASRSLAAEQRRDRGDLDRRRLLVARARPGCAGAAASSSMRSGRRIPRALRCATPPVDSVVGRVVTEPGARSILGGHRQIVAPIRPARDMRRPPSSGATTYLTPSGRFG